MPSRGYTCHLRPTSAAYKLRALGQGPILLSLSFLLCETGILNSPCLAGGCVDKQGSTGRAAVGPGTQCMEVGCYHCGGYYVLSPFLAEPLGWCLDPSREPLSMCSLNPGTCTGWGSALECRTCAMSKQHASGNIWQDTRPCFSGT